MLRFCEIPLGTGGPCCRACGTQVPVSARPTAEIVAELESCSVSCIDPLEAGSELNVDLAGGEPLAHPGLEQVVSAAVRVGAQRVRIETDCAGLADPARATRLLAAGLRHVGTTLFGGDAGVHDAISGRNGSFEATKAGLETFRRVAAEGGAHVSLTATVPVCTHTLAHVPATISAAAEMGVSWVFVRIADPALDLAQASPWILAGCDTGIVNSVWVEVQGLFYGYARGYELHLACTLRESPGGEKTDVCGECALDPFCCGASEGAPAHVMADFGPPENHEQLAEAIRRSRSVGGL
jgi:hypothetical protein